MGQQGDVVEHPRREQLDDVEALKQRLTTVLGDNADTGEFVAKVGGKELSYTEIALALAEFVLGDGNVCHVSKVDQIVEVLVAEKHRDFLLLLVGRLVNQIISS